MKKISFIFLALLLFLTACSQTENATTAGDTAQTAKIESALQSTSAPKPTQTPVVTGESAENNAAAQTTKTESTAQATNAPKPTQTPNKQQTNQGESTMNAIITMKTVTVDQTNANRPVVTIEMMSGGIIKAELYPEIAPITVKNFVSLVEKGFYDGLTFHRIIPGFMIQGGCPLGNGTGGPGYHIKGEFASNGFENNLKHERGVLSMARAKAPDSAGSQFFIMHADAPHLDGEYAAFGKVIEGMDVVDQIANS